jgi:hypothetical protein
VGVITEELPGAKGSFGRVPHHSCPVHGCGNGSGAFFPWGKQASVFVRLQNYVIGAVFDGGDGRLARARLRKKPQGEEEEAEYTCEVGCRPEGGGCGGHGRRKEFGNRE